MAIFVSCGGFGRSEQRLRGSSEPEHPALIVPINWKLTTAQQRASSEFDRLAAFDNSHRDVGCQKTEPRQADEMAAFDRIG